MQYPFQERVLLAFQVDALFPFVSYVVCTDLNFKITMK